MSDAPKIYAAIAAVQSAVAKEGISKDRKNEQQGYKFRGIDDIYNAVAPLLAANGLCIMPTYSNRTKEERTNQKGTVIFNVTVEGTFDFVSTADGSKHTVKMFGEAMDSGDKATNKAMSAAYKYACMQTFCIPTEGDNDADANTHEVVPRLPAPATAPPPAPAPEKAHAHPEPAQATAKSAPITMATANTRAAALARLDCQKEGAPRNHLHSYLVALGWLENEKVVEQWPLPFVPISADELNAISAGLVELSQSGKVVRPYAPHGLDIELQSTPVKEVTPPGPAPAPEPELPPSKPGWRDHVFTFGKSFVGKKLGDLPEADIISYAEGFVPKEEKDGYTSESVAAQKALRAALDEAQKELAPKK
jgi:hypothetical protein